jgi:hypothetical protein
MRFTREEKPSLVRSKFKSVRHRFALACLEYAARDCAEGPEFSPETQGT